MPCILERLTPSLDETRCDFYFRDAKLNERQEKGKEVATRLASNPLHLTLLGVFIEYPRRAESTC
ncbi:hypothetical protein Celaphus_00017903 [Cervus elaphus hippelaphus]|uniref:Uncharacterized protein n=1 Tax=Cervus elaphus hippelaphus TaxID=46360 RepID=A0A212C8R3_CEREH|nr:hypothetical protein Celaphus_00017903 [Cervus elaphus hippelaphus]